MRASEEFQQLMDKYLTNSITAKEKGKLFGMIRSGEYIPQLEQVIDDLLKTPVEVKEDISLREEIFAGLMYYTHPVKRIRPWRRYAAAAVILIAVTTGLYFLGQQTSRPVQPVATAFTTVQPGSNKAVLTLADGSRVTLDSAGQQVLNQGPTAIYHQGGQLKYEVQGKQPNISYNELRTPRGGQFLVILPDGTKAWLNAASSIRYPTAFNGKERRVEITGEVYMEVNAFPPGAAAPTPFTVSSAHQQVTVLGTSFNINAYEEEGVTKTTLITGKVRVSTSGNSDGVLLSPEHQAVTAHHDATNIIPVQQIDTSKVIAWKNGYFEFENEQLSVVLRLLSRWYNVDFDADPALLRLKFSAVIARSSSIKDALSLLSATKAIRFKEEGNKIKIY